MNDLFFKIGKRYKNEKGVFAVLSISDDGKMLIRWDNGDETITTVSTQIKIKNRLEAEGVKTEIPEVSTPNSAPSNQSRFLPLCDTVMQNGETRISSDFRPITQKTSMETKDKCPNCAIDLTIRPLIWVMEVPLCYLCAKKEYRARLQDFTRILDCHSRKKSNYKKQCETHEALKHKYCDDRTGSEHKGCLISLIISLFVGSVWPAIGLIALFPCYCFIECIFVERPRRRLENEFEAANPPPQMESLGETPSAPSVSLDPDCDPKGFNGPRYNRRQILERDNYCCQNCCNKFSPKFLEVHHVKPRSQDGCDYIRNLVTLCFKCHLEEEWFNHTHMRKGELIYGKKPKRRRKAEFNVSWIWRDMDI